MWSWRNRITKNEQPHHFVWLALPQVECEKTLSEKQTQMQSFFEQNKHICNSLQEVGVWEHQPSQFVHLTISSEKPQNAFGWKRRKRMLNKFIATLATSISLDLFQTKCLWPLAEHKLQSYAAPLTAWKACMMHDYLKHMDTRTSFKDGTATFSGTSKNLKTTLFLSLDCVSRPLLGRCKTRRTLGSVCLYRATLKVNIQGSDLSS